MIKLEHLTDSGKEVIKNLNGVNVNTVPMGRP
jgi:hypothetical protein